MRAKLVSLAVAVVYCSCIIACGGGGGGGRSTALRVLHGGIQVSPVDVLIDGIFLQSAHFADVTAFAAVSPGPRAVDVNRANSPDVNFNSLSFQFADNVQYSLLVSYNQQTRNPQVTLLEQPIVEPAQGAGRVQLINALEGSSPLSLTIGGASTPAASYATASGFIDTGVGPQTGSIRNSSGREVAQVSLDVGDRGELSVLVTGQTSLGQQFVRVFDDLAQGS